MTQKQYPKNLAIVSLSSPCKAISLVRETAAYGVSIPLSHGEAEPMAVADITSNTARKCRSR